MAAIQQQQQSFAPLSSSASSFSKTATKKSVVVDVVPGVPAGDDLNLYAVLGCSPQATVEQVLAEYRARALLLHPDKLSAVVVGGGGDVVSDEQQQQLEQFHLLQYAKEVLADEAKRRHYDLFLQMKPALSLQEWMENREKIQQTLHWATKKGQQMGELEAKPMSIIVPGEEHHHLHHHEHRQGGESGGSSVGSSCGSPRENYPRSFSCWKSHNSPTLAAFRAYKI